MQFAEGERSPVLDHLLVIWELRILSALPKPPPGVVRVMLRLSSASWVCVCVCEWMKLLKLAVLNWLCFRIQIWHIQIVKKILYCTLSVHAKHRSLLLQETPTFRSSDLHQAYDRNDAVSCNNKLLYLAWTESVRDNIFYWLDSTSLLECFSYAPINFSGVLSLCWLSISKL